MGHALQAAIVIGYFFIAYEFLVLLRKVKRNGREKVSIVAMVAIFVLCGVTMILSDFGVDNWLSAALHLALAFFTWTYVLIGQSRVIECGVRDAIDSIPSETTAMG